MIKREPFRFFISGISTDFFFISFSFKTYSCTHAVSCVLPALPLNGALLNTNSQNTILTERSVITFQCDPGFSLVGAVTVTCNSSGLWDPDPTLLECEFIDLCLPACMYAA